MYIDLKASRVLLRVRRGAAYLARAASSADEAELLTALPEQMDSLEEARLEGVGMVAAALSDHVVQMTSEGVTLRMPASYPPQEAKALTLAAENVVVEHALTSWLLLSAPALAPTAEGRTREALERLRDLASHRRRPAPRDEVSRRLEGDGRPFPRDKARVTIE